MMIFKRLKFPVFITIILAVSFALAGCGEKTITLPARLLTVSRMQAFRK